MGKVSHGAASASKFSLQLQFMIDFFSQLSSMRSKSVDVQANADAVRE